MTSVTPMVPTKGAVLGGFALAAALVAGLLLLAIVSPIDSYLKLLVFFVSAGAIPVGSIVATILGILAIRSRKQPNRVLGIVALVIVGVVVAVVIFYIVTEYVLDLYPY